MSQKNSNYLYDCMMGSPFFAYFIFKRMDENKSGGCEVTNGHTNEWETFLGLLLSARRWFSLLRAAADSPPPAFA